MVFICAKCRPDPDTAHYLYSLKRFGIRPGLEMVSRALSGLEDPHKGFKSILVGGTNGKGSVCAMLSEVLQSAGYTTGLYTSPHLNRFTERIRINGREISEEDLSIYINRLREISDGLIETPLTFFEFITVMSFLYFYDKKVDIALIEVGMGGRLDATNVLEPVVSVVTNVSFEHERFLGKTLFDIAKEKGGIIKEGGLLVTGAKGRALNVLKGICMEKKAELMALGEDFFVEECGDTYFNYKGKSLYSDIRLGLKGSHQKENAAIAIAALEGIRERGFKIEDEDIYKGLEKTFWPGRLEFLDIKGKSVLLDCAHNYAGAKVLKEFLLKEAVYTRLYLVIGIMQDKAADKILKTLLPLAEMVILTQPGQERAMDVDLLAEKALVYNPNSIKIKNVDRAVGYGIETMTVDDLLCITGSIFTVGEARSGVRSLILT